MDATRARQLGYQSAGEVAEMLGVTLRTVRYYEEQGLVTPTRTDKGTRYYSDFDVQRLEVCVRLAAVGVPIKTLRQLATIRPNSVRWYFRMPAGTAGLSPLSIAASVTERAASIR